MSVENRKKVHFIGVGGCSMSGLALLMSKQGCIVTGSDQSASHYTEDLIGAGISVSIGHDARNVHGADLIVYTAAIPEHNCERQEAVKLGIPQIERATLLGRLTASYETSICVSGTHGKTTTTAMISQVFVQAGENPSVHIGGALKALGGGTILGGSETFICEACEFKKSFLQMFPTIGVILNIDEDHLDCYKDIDEIEATFKEFAYIIPRDGWCVGWGDDKRVRNVLESVRCRTRSFGIEPHNEIRAEDISYDEQGRARFTATLFGHPLMDVEMSVAGEHNLIDALACIAVAEICQLPMTRVGEILSKFSGADRRFELTSVTDGVSVYTDYGHNPAEIKNALHNAAMQPHNTLWSVWQPHTYGRTKTLYDGFMETFHEADKVLVTDICIGRGREEDPGDLNSAMLVADLKKHGVDAVLTPSFDDTEKYLREHWQAGDVVVSHGCGDINLLNEQIAAHGDTKR